MKSPLPRIKDWFRSAFPDFIRYGSTVRSSNYLLLRTSMQTWRFLPMWRDLFRYLSLACRLSHPLDETVASWLEENRSYYRPEQVDAAEALLEHFRNGGGLGEFVLAHSPYFINDVRDLFAVAGPRAGTREALDSARELMDDRAVLLLRIQDAVSYPVFLFIFACLVVSVILWKIIPTFSALFISLGSTLPLATRLVVAFANFWVDNSLLFLLAAIVLLILVVRSEKVLRALRRAGLRVPALRAHLYRLERVRLLRALCILARQGRLDPPGLAAAGDHLTIDACRDEWAGFVEALRGGARWSRAIGGVTFLTPEIGFMLASFSRDREPARMVLATHELYAERARTLSHYLLRSVEPALIILLGLLLGLVILGMYSPMFSLIGKMT